VSFQPTNMNFEDWYECLLAVADNSGSKVTITKKIVMNYWLAGDDWEHALMELEKI